MQMQPNTADTLHPQAAILNRPTGSIRKAEGLEPVAAFETGKPCLLSAALDAPEECREGNVYLFQRPSLHGDGVHRPYRISPQFGEAAALIWPGATLASLAVAVDTLRKSRVIKITGLI